MFSFMAFTASLDIIVTLSQALELNWSSIVQPPEELPLQQSSLQSSLQSSSLQSSLQQQPIGIQAVDDTAITISGESVDIDVLANDILPNNTNINNINNENISIELRERGNNGICVVHDDTKFVVYYPMHRYAGYDRCVYILCHHTDTGNDDDDDCDVATVTITIVKSQVQEGFVPAVEENNDRPLPSIEEVLDGLDVVVDTGRPESEPAIEEEKGEDSNDWNPLDLNDVLLEDNESENKCRDIGQIAAQGKQHSL